MKYNKHKRQIVKSKIFLILFALINITDCAYNQVVKYYKLPNTLLNYGFRFDGGFSFYNCSDQNNNMALNTQVGYSLGISIYISEIKIHGEHLHFLQEFGIGVKLFPSNGINTVFLYKKDSLNAIRYSDLDLYPFINCNLLLKYEFSPDQTSLYLLCGVNTNYNYYTKEILKNYSGKLIKLSYGAIFGLGISIGRTKFPVIEQGLGIEFRFNYTINDSGKNPTMTVSYFTLGVKCCFVRIFKKKFKLSTPDEYIPKSVIKAALESNP